MKPLKNKFWTLIMISSVTFFSCKKPDPINPTKPETVTVTTDNPNFTRGQWKVKSFEMAGIDESANLRGYLFMFNPDKSVSVTKSNTTLIGSWGVTKVGDDKQFILSFPSGGPMEKLAGDWKIKFETDINLGLERMNADSSMDNLVFDRYFAQ
ncbi:MAG: hypothetical protein K0R26_1559 [Bacteroidota bacterium]|jgi:hypothetical protein|nr:hypothetical protein [Bacteroidota bacterium]